MTAHININICHGNAFVKPDDITRAAAAAMNYFTAHGVDPMEAQTEFQRQWMEIGTYDGMTGAALAWVDAQQAADLALTAGWHSPDGAFCEIEAWQS